MSRRAARRYRRRSTPTAAIRTITCSTVRALAYGSYAPVDPPGVDLGSAGVQQPLSVHLQNLEAGTTYHYRLCRGAGW